MADMLRAFRWPMVAMAAGLAAAWAYRGLAALGVVAALIALETTMSFNNAVVNAGVLRQLTERWARAFLTIGVVIAVFGMRLVFPIAIVALATGGSFGAVVGQALHDQETYARNVASAAPLIGAYGGMFLLLLALQFLLQPKRENYWIAPVERGLARLGRLPKAPLIVGGLTLMASALLVSAEHERVTLLAGLAGLLTFLSLNAFRSLMQRRRGGRSRGELGGAAGLAGFIYLEALDASFSLDGVLGAFAISADIFLVAIGLGVGAMFVRSLTVHLVRHGTLRTLPYLAHGAHWAVAALAVFLLVSIEREPPKWLTGGVSVGIIAAAWLSSLAAKHRTESKSVDPV